VTCICVVDSDASVKKYLYLTHGYLSCKGNRMCQLHESAGLHERETNPAQHNVVYFIIIFCLKVDITHFHCCS
jgi:hypothetical protein